MTLHAPSRRELLLASGTLFSWAFVPKLALAEGRDPRLLVIVLRGALDGLAAVAPVGDPEWQRLRGDKALTLESAPAALRLDPFFALNPAMPNLHRLYKAGAATIVHAAATPYRSAPISMARMCWRAGFPRRAPPTAAGSIARLRRCSPRAASAARMPSPSDLLHRWWCVGRPRSCHGRRDGCRRRATTR